MTINQKDLYEIIYYHNGLMYGVGQNFAVDFILFGETILLMVYVRILLGAYASA